MDNVESVKKNLAITFEHMLKLKYRTNDQNNSWFRSALCFYQHLKYLKPATFADCVRDETLLEEAFEKGLDSAVNTKKASYTYEMFPSSLPHEWNILNLTDLDFMKEFILKYAADDKKNDAGGDIVACMNYKKMVDKMRSKYNKYVR